MTFNQVFDSFPIPGQHACEWRWFMALVKIYFEIKNVWNPQVVEIGIKKKGQKPFYEKMLNAFYLGVDYDMRFVVPDVLGNSQEESTRDDLVKKLNGKSIDLLFIDANHRYQFVKRDYELYSPLVKYLVVFHDINHPGPKRLWKELQEEKPENRTFVTISNLFPTKQFPGKEGKLEMGIGIIIKEE
jgi:hypothetical protein